MEIYYWRTGLFAALINTLVGIADQAQPQG
jgi:hypothetical protein